MKIKKTGKNEQNIQEKFKQIYDFFVDQKISIQKSIDEDILIQQKIDQFLKYICQQNTVLKEAKYQALFVRNFQSINSYQKLAKDGTYIYQQKLERVSVFKKDILQNIEIYGKLFSYFFAHPCLFIKMFLNENFLNINFSVNNQKLIKQVSTSKFTQNDDLYKSYLYSLILLLFKTECTQQINKLFDKKNNFQINQSFVLIYKKLQKNIKKQQNLFNDILNNYCKKIINSNPKEFKILKKLKNIEEDLQENTNKQKKLQTSICFLESLENIFNINNSDLEIDPFLISINKKIYKLIKMYFKKLYKKNQISQSIKQQVKFLIVNIYFQQFYDLVSKKYQKMAKMISEDHQNYKEIKQKLKICDNLIKLLDLQNFPIFFQDTNDIPVHLNYTERITKIYNKIFSSIIFQPKSQKHLNTFINFQQNIKQMTQPDFPIFINIIEFQLFLQQTCKKFIGLQNQQSLQSNYHNNSQYFIQGNESSMDISNSSSSFEESQESSKTDSNSESDLSFNEKINFDQFIQNKKISKLLKLINNQIQKDYDLSQFEQIQINIKPSYSNMNNNKDNFLGFCSNCELIVPQKLLLQTDQKICKQFQNKKWPCFFSNQIHFYNDAKQLQCQYFFQKTNEFCKRNVNYLIYQSMFLLKRTPLNIMSDLQIQTKFENFLNIIQTQCYQDLDDELANIIASQTFQTRSQLSQFQKSSIQFDNFILYKNKQNQLLGDLNIIYKIYEKLSKHRIYQQRIYELIRDFQLQYTSQVQNKRSQCQQQIQKFYCPYFRDINELFKISKQVLVKKDFTLDQLRQDKTFISYIDQKNPTDEYFQKQFIVEITYQHFQFTILIKYQTKTYQNKSEQKETLVIKNIPIQLDQMNKLIQNFGNNNIQLLARQLLISQDNFILLLSQFFSIAQKQLNNIYILNSHKIIKDDNILISVDTILQLNMINLLFIKITQYNPLLYRQV